MASPFSIFRKNQKVMLATLTILAMFGFVFLPIILEGLSYRTVKNPDVVTSAFGDLTERDLQNMKAQRYLTMNVLSNAMMGLWPNNPELAQRYVEYRLGRTTEQQLVDTWLLARNAEKMGIVVSDQVINAFLRQFTDNRVRTAEFQAAFKRVGISELAFFTAMREELLAMQLRIMFGYSLMPFTPDQRWDFFNRLKEQASIEAVAAPVSRFVDQVANPSDAELTAFFEKYKEEYAYPDSPTPGFREPQRIDLEYVTADYEKALAAVTDEQVMARYQQNKNLYDQMEKGAAARAAAPVTPETKTPETAAAAKPAEPEKAAETKTPAATPDAQKPAESTPPAAQKPEAKKPEAAKPAAPAVKKEEPKPEQKQPEPKKPEAKPAPQGTSQTGRRSPFMFASYADEKPADKPTEKPADKTPVAKPAEKPAVAPAAKADEKKAEDKKTADKPAATPAAQPTAKPAAQPAAKPAAQPAAKPEVKTPAPTEKPAAKPAEQAKPAPKAETKPAEPKAGPSDRLKQFIRNEIVTEEMQKKFDAVRGQVELYRTEWMKAEDARIRGKEAVEPPKLDLKAIAEKAGLQSGTTGMISQIEAQQTPLGKARVMGQQPVSMYAFGSFSDLRPEEARDTQGNFYLFWKTGSKKERVPKFTDPGVREKVLEAWKLVEARKPALAEAEKLAAKAREAKTDLKQVFANQPDLSVVTPSPFTWLTSGQVPMGSAPDAARISEVAGVSMAGEAFMKAVFTAEPGGVAVAMNAPQNVVYIIRLVDMKPSQNVRWAEFITANFKDYAAPAQNEQHEIYLAWVESLKKESNFKWAAGRKPDQRSNESQSPEESATD